MVSSCRYDPLHEIVPIDYLLPTAIPEYLAQAMYCGTSHVDWYGREPFPDELRLIPSLNAKVNDIKITSDGLPGILDQAAPISDEEGYGMFSDPTFWSHYECEGSHISLFGGVKYETWTW